MGGSGGSGGDHDKTSHAKRLWRQITANIHVHINSTCF